jgi:hypothetical protein
MSEPGHTPLSQDAALVVTLAGTAMAFAHSADDEAERWLRVMRLHGQVGDVLQALGVGEAPPLWPRGARPCHGASRRLRGRPRRRVRRHCRPAPRGARDLRPSLRPRPAGARHLAGGAARAPRRGEADGGRTLEAAGAACVQTVRQKPRALRPSGREPRALRPSGRSRERSGHPGGSRECSGRPASGLLVPGQVLEADGASQGTER